MNKYILREYTNRRTKMLNKLDSLTYMILLPLCIVLALVWG